MSPKQLSIRFAAGTPDGKRSRVWKMRAHFDDIYLATQSSGALWKCSLHGRSGVRPPICNFSITSEAAAKIRLRTGLPKGSRHLKQWRRAREDEFGQSVGMRLHILSEGMRERPLEDSKPIVWLGNPARGEIVEVAFVYCRCERATNALLAWNGWSQLVDWTLTGGERFRAFHRLRPAGYAPQLEELFRTLPNRIEWSSGRINLDHPDAGWIFYPIGPDGTATLQDISHIAKS